MVVFGGDLAGGFCGVVANDVWVLSHADGGTRAWTQLSPLGAPPSGRDVHSAVYDSANNRMIIFGGNANACGSVLNDVWVLSNANGQVGTPIWTQLFPTGDPGAREAVYDSGSNRMIVFAGRGVTGAALDDLWILSNANGLGGIPNWTQLAPVSPPPPARFGHTAVYDASQQSDDNFWGSRRRFF